MSLENYNSRDIQEKYKKYLKKNFKVDKKVSKTIPNAKNFEDVSEAKKYKKPNHCY